MIIPKYDNYCITGCCGFIGSHLAEYLIKHNKHVIGIDNLIAGKIENIKNIQENPNFKFFNVDITDTVEIDHLTKNVDALFHLAASKCTVCQNDPYLDLKTNAQGSYTVFNAAQKNKVKKVIYASTGSVTDIRSFYGVSKQAAENYAKVLRNYYPDFKYTILRYFHVYGTRQDAGDKGGVIPIFITKVLNEQPIKIYGSGYQKRHFTTVEDIVKVNILVSQWEETDNKIYNVVSDVCISINSLANMIIKLMGKSKLYPVVYYPEKPGDIYSFSNIDNEPLKKLGIKFDNNLENNLSRTIEWYRRRRNNNRHKFKMENKNNR